MKTNKRKKCLWTIADESLLIKLWKERLHDLRNTRRSKPIYEEIRDKLNRKGCFVGVDEVKHKVHNLTTKKEKQSRSSGYSPTEWEFYDVLDDMFSTYHPGNIINLEEESSKSCSDDYAPTENVSQEDVDKNYRQEYANENFFDNEDEENEPEERTSTPIVDRRNISNSNEHQINYFKDINQNLKLMVEKVFELSDHIQAWEEKGNEQLAQITQILKKHTTRTDQDYANVSVSSKKRRLSQYDDDDCAIDDIAELNEFIANGEVDNENEMRICAVKVSISKRNKIVLDDYLKTMELERQFLTEKHKIQMEILKLELEAKRNECLRDT